MSPEALEMQAFGHYEQLGPASEQLSDVFDVILSAVAQGAAFREIVTFTQENIPTGSSGDWEQYVGRQFMLIQYPSDVEDEDCWVSTASVHVASSELGKALTNKLKNGTSKTH